jgi:hypothetical protein
MDVFRGGGDQGLHPVAFILSNPDMGKGIEMIPDLPRALAALFGALRGAGNNHQIAGQLNDAIKEFRVHGGELTIDD